MRHLFAVLILVLTMACNPRGPEPLIIGHRGAMGHETENTLASIEKAMELGVDMIEIDVFRISSGEIVVFHDERVERLTNGGGRIEDYNIFDMKKLILDGGHSIPQLQDVLRLIDANVPLNIELKGAGTADRVNFITDYYVEKYGWQPGQFLISSFDWDELRAFRAQDADSRIAVLTDGDPLKALDVARELKAEAINPSAAGVTAENVAAIHEAGFKVYVWTVNETVEFEALREMGVDGIFTDYPDRMR
jgi:glycerophosphoryl diester phosphodiesterase